MSKSTPTKHDERTVLFAVAELLVIALDASGAAYRPHEWYHSLCVYDKLVNISL